MRIDNSMANANFRQANKPVNFNARLEINLPPTILKDMDPHKNLSGKELLSVKNFIGFVENYVGQVVKIFPKDDVYKLDSYNWNNHDDCNLKLEFLPGEKSKAKGIEQETLAYIDHQTILRHEIGKEQLRTVSYFFGRVHANIGRNMQAVAKNIRTLNDRHDAKLKAALLRGE